MTRVDLGVERLVENGCEELAGERTGLVTNPSGVDSRLRSTIDLLADHEAVDLRRLFGPEHGIRGSAGAGETVADAVDERTGLPVTSLYGDRRRPPPVTLSDLDVLVYDVQDVGSRYYTVIYTLAYAMEAAAASDVRFVVLDRPNPIAPLGVAGNRITDGRTSFVGDYRLPACHGLTTGEIADYVAGEFDVPVDLTVVELDGWSRDQWFDGTGLPWVPPSPNMPTPGTATLYPGTCLLEGITLSEGRGTTLPFHLAGAPWIDAAAWADRSNDLGFDGVRFRPAFVTPWTGRFEGEEIEAVQVHCRDRDAVRPLAVGLAMVSSAMFTFPETEWVTVDGTYFIDRLTGDPAVRERIDAGEMTDPRSLAERLLEGWAEDRATFERLRPRYERY